MINYQLLKKYSRNLDVLVIDDDIKVIQSLKRTLETIFKNVNTASNGVIAYESYLNYKNTEGKFYDIVITDINMPEIDGIALVKLIYKVNPKQNIIVLSAYNSPENLLELVNVRINQFFVKPLDINNFLLILFRQIELIYNEQNHVDLIEINDFISWNRKIKCLYKHGIEISLTKTEIELIDLFSDPIGEIRSSEFIIKYIWDNNFKKYPNNGNLKNIIARLRKKVPELNIINIYGAGYKIDTKSKDK